MNVFKEFEELIKEKKSHLSVYKKTKIDIGSNVTDSSSSSVSLFVLSDPDELIIEDWEVDEVVKRLHITEDIAECLVLDPMLLDAVLQNMEYFMEDHGCYCYTFTNPDYTYASLVEDSNKIEIRCYGYKLKNDSNS